MCVALQDQQGNGYCGLTKVVTTRTLRHQHSEQGNEMAKAQRHEQQQPAGRQFIEARQLRRGATMFDSRCGGLALLVINVFDCADGSVRVITDRSEQRMTRSIKVCVLH